MNTTCSGVLEEARGFVGGNVKQGVVWSGVLGNRELFLYLSEGPRAQKRLRRMAWAVLCRQEHRAREQSSPSEHSQCLECCLTLTEGSVNIC